MITYLNKYFTIFIDKVLKGSVAHKKKESLSDIVVEDDDLKKRQLKFIDDIQEKFGLDICVILHDLRKVKHGDDWIYNYTPLTSHHYDAFHELEKNNKEFQDFILSSDNDIYDDVLGGIKYLKKVIIENRKRLVYKQNKSNCNLNIRGMK